MTPFYILIKYIFIVTSAVSTSLPQLQKKKITAVNFFYRGNFGRQGSKQVSTKNVNGYVTYLRRKREGDFNVYNVIY